MHEIYELKEKLCEELEEYGRKGDLDVGSLEIVDKLAHAVKNLGKIIEMSEEEEYSGNYMYADGGAGGGTYRNGRSYARGGRSYARGRTGNVRRDSMGRYSREGGYSRADEMEDMADTIRSMMNKLPPEIQKDAQRFVEKLDQHMM